MALLCSSTKPPYRLGVVLGNALAIVVHKPETELSIGAAKFCGPAVPPHRLGIVLGNAHAVLVPEPELVLNISVILLGVNSKPPKVRGVVILLVCRYGLFKCLRRSGKRADGRQQQCHDKCEESSRTAPRAHVSSAPFDTCQPVDLLSAWSMNTHEGSVPVPRRRPRRGPITVAHRFRAKVPSETDPPRWCDRTIHALARHLGESSGQPRTRCQAWYERLVCRTTGAGS